MENGPMRYLFCVPLLLLAAFPAWADEPAKPNTLTAKEVEDGWILLFDGKTTFGWKIDGEAKVENGVLVLGGTKPTKAEPTTALDWSNFEARIDTRWEGTAPPSFKLFGPVPTSVGDAGRDFYPASIKRTRSRSLPAITEELMPHEFVVPAGSKLLIRNLKYRPLELQPIFNGKDLTGWKEFPGKKSKFSVTPEGWINIKNGPGDLQTVGQWGNFVLQVDCFSNGKNLNSGVFFRCQPDNYQQGYEAQIHNGFTPEPAKTYTLEEYDPKTHKKTGEKKVKYAAIDYGTGAIYRRQPARFQVAKDHEWFTMTIVAKGNHFAVWVNGIEVTDWTDNRPPSDNARNGYRQEKGPISLQGHDPTTNLNFRNIRIAELPPPAGDSGVPKEKK
jgi:hypothetical protein